MNDRNHSEWLRAYGSPVISCRVRQHHEDFVVDEQLGFELSGDGGHDYLHVEKRGANATWVAAQLARYAGVSGADVGFAGMKDRNALTTQWFSVSRPAGRGPNWRSLALEGVRIIELSRHRRKLRRGAHKTNRFRIALAGVQGSQEMLLERLETIRTAGVPNYFGDQRFGRDGHNLSLARKLFGGKRLPRDKRSLALSAARSFLFNHVLQNRVALGTWNKLLPGDCASLDGSGSFFRVAAPDRELERRAASLDIHPSGPLWGAGELPSSGEAAACEQSVADRYPELSAGLGAHRLRHARRALRLRIRGLAWELSGGSVILHFVLARGGYATAVLREIFDS